jgi:hypothetical protein
MIEGFQSVRTALAHSSPPAITFKDVTERIEEMRVLVGGIDRLFFSHVVKNGGVSCWN